VLVDVLAPNLELIPAHSKTKVFARLGSSPLRIR